MNEYPNKIIEVKEENEGKEKTPVDFKKDTDLILVHVTDYRPIQYVYSPNDTSKKMVRDEFIVGNWCPIEYTNRRRTVHFTVNSVVKANDGGNWDIRKYAVLIPLELVDKESIYSHTPEDFFFSKSVKIPDGAYIMCPEEEKEIMQLANPKCNISAYHGDTVMPHVEDFLKQLGYTTINLGSNSWNPITDEEKNCKEIILNI